MSKKTTHSGFIAVTGRPNAGKSSLINAIIGNDITIVSRVAQTTRRVVRAIHNIDEFQMIFVDLPGSQKPLDEMTKRMQSTVVNSFSDVDAVLWVIDVSEKIGAGERTVSRMISESNLPLVIALNKIDKVKPIEIAKRIESIVELLDGSDFQALVPISSTKNDGIQEIVEELKKVIPEGPAWFSEDDQTDMRDDELICEYIREAMLEDMRDELPHASIVTVEEIRSEPGEKQQFIDAVIWVENKSQVGIVVGKQGAMLGKIGTTARKKIQEQLGRRFHLNLRVKVRRNWRNDPNWLSRSGL